MTETAQDNTCGEVGSLVEVLEPACNNLGLNFANSNRKTALLIYIVENRIFAKINAVHNNVIICDIIVHSILCLKTGIETMYERPLPGYNNSPLYCS